MACGIVEGMELLTNVGAVVTGLVTVVVGGFAIMAILVDDLF